MPDIAREEEIFSKEGAIGVTHGPLELPHQVERAESLVSREEGG